MPAHPVRHRLLKLSYRILRWYDNDETGSLALFGVHFQLPAMPLGDDIIAHTEAQTRSLSRWLGRKERLKDLFPDDGRDTVPVIFHRHLYLTVKPPGRHGHSGR